MGKLHSFLLLLFSLQCCSIASFAWSETNIISDKYELLALKTFVTSDPYNILANWSVSFSPCKWVGVTCDIHTERVNSLNLSDMGLTSILSPRLGNLSFLSELDLSNNNFHGQTPNEFVQLRIIPVEIRRLEHLKILQLGANKLSGIVPQRISNLSSHEILNLSNNTLSGSIPYLVGYLPQLKKLYLERNLLVGSVPSLFNSSMLQHIATGTNQLSGSLPTNECFGLPKLETFLVEENYLSGKMPSIWHQCKELTKISLSDNRFNRGYIPSDIGNLTNLRLLHLSKTTWKV
ncbi:receptor kinase-like protein Xa21 [Prosopis cineraria]|uniref:receptor kinase-like protein Xa21 n=1 Tax=Prosopis cineraria TaxID=364024 RepID=UPI00240FAF98|nr:receptor kinase-like protein Xa21 [Prosopis cineraria]